MAKRHPGARRTQQAPSHDPDDIFLAKVLETGQWAQAHQQILTVVGVVSVIAVAGVMYYGNFRENLAQQAAQQLESVHQSISIQDREGAKSELVTFLQNFGGTPYEGEARLLLGDLYLETDDAEQAEAVLEPLGASPRKPIEFQGAALLGAAYEQEGRSKDAEEIYLRIADRSELDFQIREALENAARIRAGEGNVEGAIELYERVLADLDDNAPERGVYEMRIAELKTAAQANI
jgi:hypothetical protein